MMNYSKKLALLLLISMPFVVKSDTAQQKYSTREIISMLQAINSINPSDRSPFETALAEIITIKTYQKGYFYDNVSTVCHLSKAAQLCQDIPAELMHIVITIMNTHADNDGIVNTNNLDQKIAYGYFLDILQKNESAECESCKLLEDFFIQQKELIEKKTARARKELDDILKKS